jgi:hypothetical protein
MRILLLSLLLSLLSCNPFSGGDSSAGNGGTDIDGDTVEVYTGESVEDIDDENLTSQPNYHTYSLSQEITQAIKIQIKFTGTSEQELIQSVYINNQFNSHTEVKNTEFTELSVSLINPAVITSFKLIFKKSITPFSLKEIKLIKNGVSDALLFYGSSLNDNRTTFYGSNTVTFSLSQNSCVAPKTLDHQGQCIQNYLYCSDFPVVIENPNPDALCRILRDDSQEVFCYKVGDNQSCTDKTTTLCSVFPEFVQYHNQMFWSEINSQMIKSIQCPKG